MLEVVWKVQINRSKADEPWLSVHALKIRWAWGLVVTNMKKGYGQIWSGEFNCYDKFTNKSKMQRSLSNWFASLDHQTKVRTIGNFITSLDKRLITSWQKLRLAGANSTGPGPFFLARITVNCFIGVYLSEVSTEDVVARGPSNGCALAALRLQIRGHSHQTLALINVIYSSRGSATGTIVPLLWRGCVVRAVGAHRWLVLDPLMTLARILSHGRRLWQKIWSVIVLLIDCWLGEWPGLNLRRCLRYMLLLAWCNLISFRV